MMKSAAKSFISAALIMLLCLLFLPTTALASGTSSYEISRLFTSVDVSKRKACEISHSFSLRFTEDVSSLTVRLPVTGSNSRIALIKVSGRSYKAEKAENSVIVTIDDRQSAGSVQEYSISYTLLEGEEPKDGQDLLLIDLVSSHWEADIPDVSFSVELPEDFDESGLSFTSGYFGLMDEQVSVQKVGNTISGTIKGGLRAYESVTLSLPLPMGYFKISGAPMTAADRIAIIAPWLTLILMAAAALIWLIPRRNRFEKPQRRSYPPEGCTPADAAYILRGMVRPRQLVALILYWAGKGYLTIDEGQKKGELILIRRMDMGDERKQYERQLFVAIFQSGDSVSLRQLSGRLYEHLSAAADKVDKYWRGSRESRIYAGGTLPILICRLLSCISFAFAAVAAMNGPYQLELSRSILLLPLLVFGFAASLPVQFAGEALGDLAPDSLIGSAARLLAAASLLALSGIALIGLGSFASLMSIVLSAFTGFTAARGPLKTDYGYSMTRQLIGLRRFMLTAEKKRLYELTSDSPSYFYDSLPYAMAMGVSERWASRWMGIPLDPPSWFGAALTGGKFSSLDFIKTLDRVWDAMVKSLITKPKSKAKK